MDAQYIFDPKKLEGFNQKELHEKNFQLRPLAFSDYSKGTATMFEFKSHLLRR